MKKIPSLFERNFTTDKLVRDELVAGCEWVVAGEGLATRKRDGTACLVRSGKLFKRFDAKKGKTPPPSFEPCQPEADPETGHHPGWVPVGDVPEDKWHKQTWDATIELVGELHDGTYELCGPKIQGNPERLAEHTFFAHGIELLDGVPRDYTGLRTWLAEHDVEGIVWHHPDGRMCKIKKVDFGLAWASKAARS